MNKKGFSFILTFMLTIICFFLGLALANPLSEVTYEQWTSLNCSNASISTETKSACTTIDLFAPFFTGVIFAMGGMLMGRKFT